MVKTLQSITFVPMKSSVDDRVTEKVRLAKKGSVLLVEDFLDLGPPSAVHIALHRLTKSKELTRLGRGIYAKPDYNSLVGEILPSTEEVALAIAKRDKARILPTGLYALHMLGLSTQIPLNLVYLTDGAPRKIKLGKRTILFKKTTPKNLSLKGNISKLVVQAIREIGKDNIGSYELEKILKLLKREDRKLLKHDIALAPQWIAVIMSKAL